MLACAKYVQFLTICSIQHRIKSSSLYMKDVLDCRRCESNANKSKLPEERPRPGFFKVTSEGSKHQQVPPIISTPDPDELVIPPNQCNMEKTNPSPDYVSLKNYPASRPKSRDDQKRSNCFH